MSAHRRGEFVAWQHEVDREINRLTGLSSRDLADQPWWDWFADDVPAARAARQALRADGFETPQP